MELGLGHVSPTVRGCADVLALGLCNPKNGYGLYLACSGPQLDSGMGEGGHDFLDFPLLWAEKGQWAGGRDWVVRGRWLRYWYPHFFTSFL
jgi:hypothetical protein